MARPRPPIPTPALLVLAYLSACYALAAWFYAGGTFDGRWFVAAPLTVPLLFGFTLLLIGNSELPVGHLDLLRMAGIFLVLFVAAMEILWRLWGPNDRRR